MMDPALEIRKLKPSHVRELAKSLESGESWKNLMSRIPERLERFNYACEISLHNRNKYHSEHYRLIQNYAEKTNITCTEILFDEWGTSGRVRPTLGHLLHLLTKAELFRAADYVAELLGKPKPPRPPLGPARKINVNIEEIEKEDLNKLEEHLNEINHVQEAIEEIRKKSEETAAKIKSMPKTIPEIKISLSVEEEPKEENVVTELIPMVVPRTEVKKVDEPNKIIESNPQLPDSFLTNSDNYTSGQLPNFSKINCESQDMNNEFQAISDDSKISNTDTQSINESINYSSEEIPNFGKINESEHQIDSSASGQLPDFSKINETSDITNSSNALPDFNKINESSYIKTNKSDESNYNLEQLPNLSELNIDHTSKQLLSENYISEQLIPNLSELNNSSNLSAKEDTNFNSELLPQLSELNYSSKQLPNFTELANDTETESPELADLSRLPDPESSRQITADLKCSSPLPQLSLNTILPHISYSTLQISTGNFNEISFTNEDEAGRFLGSGAFGAVYIGFGVFERPVAIKKLRLENLVKNLESVEVDDTVTKQFRNEVELLSRYKHEKLTNLLGYSCDGLTYCLVYEYVPGGALKDKLRMKNGVLTWQQRLQIALGTAESIAYLHTAFEVPLIHRDVKSANILLDTNNNPKLCDFGLIKLAGESASVETTTIFGTSAYMPTEAFANDISDKTDVFSFGVVLLELLTSLPPVDVEREDRDLVTHVRSTCDTVDDILKLLDYNAGRWKDTNDVNHGKNLFEMALKCLDIKKKRPLMVDIKNQLENIVKTI